MVKEEQSTANYLKMSKWIPCKKRMPKEYDVMGVSQSEEVLITICWDGGKDKASAIGFTRYGKWYFIQVIFSLFNPPAYVMPVRTDGGWQVTAWMPRPEPYEEGGEDE